MDDNYLGKLSLDIGKEWCLLAYELGFSDSQLDHLRAAFPYNIPQCVASMLVKWQEIALKHSINPLPLLTQALTGVDRYDLVQKINSDFDEPDDQVNDQSEKLSVFKAEVKKIGFGQAQGDMQMFLDQTQRFLEFQLKDKKFFVNTRASKDAFDILCSKGTLTLMGNPGDGKSTIAVHLLTRLRNEGATILVLSDPALIERVYDDDKQIVYFVDDAFGTPTMNMRLLETWTRLHDKIESLIKLEKCKLLITTRKHVYMKCQSLLYKCPSYKENLVDLSGEKYRLSMIEKNRIVASYCQDHGLFPAQLSFTKGSAYVPGFPLLCKMFGNDKRMQELDIYFDQTLSVLYNQLKMLATTDVHAFCGLVLIMMFDGNLPREMFDQFTPCSDQDRSKIQTIMRVYGIQACDDVKVEACLEEMIGVYVEEVDEVFQFIHDAIFDTVCLVFGTRYPNEIIRVASSCFIEKRIRTENIPGRGNLCLDDVIVLKKSKYHVLAARWIADASRGIIRAMFVNPSIRDADMQAALVDRIRKLDPKASLEFLTSSETKPLSTNQFKETVLFLACKKGLVSLVQVLLEKQRILKDDHVKNASNLTIPDSCMMEAVDRIHLKVVQALLDHGATVNFSCGSMSYRCLHVACKKGSLDMVKLLISYGADVNLKDHTEKQAVHYACEFGRLEILKELYNKNASLSAKDMTDRQAIHYAGMAGSLECVQFLQQEGGIQLSVPDRMDKTVLHYASTVHCPALIKYLVASGIDIKSFDSVGASPLHLACRSGMAENVEILLTNGSDPNQVDASMCLPLHSACKGAGTDQNGCDTFQCVQLLLSATNDLNAVDRFGKTALHYACTWARDRRLDCVTLLLSKGADPRIMDDYGRQPIFYACESGNLKCVHELVNSGVDVNHRGPHGKQPIHYACGRGTVEVVKTLVAKGASITSVDSKGKQPLHYACQHGNEDCVRYLLEWRVDVNCVDEQGCRPLHYACKWCRPDAVRLLIKHGANPDEQDNDNRTPDDLVPKWSTRRSRIKRFLRGESLNTM